jgi:predicted CoA-substrate-specific enzyme activase
MHLGIDIGSVSIKYAIIDKKINIIEDAYYRTNGDIIAAAKKLLAGIKAREIESIGITGSGRKFLSVLLSADYDIDEITAHRTAVNKLYPEVRTIFEIGGQDSKLIYMSNGSVNFEMNNVCAAGTGSFLDQQASRLSMTIDEFCRRGLETKESHKIASKCTVFAESDMIHAQQSGIPLAQIIRGVHRGLINNYFSQLCRGKKLEADFLFEGGTSENPVLIEEFRHKLLEEGLIGNESQFIIPKPYNKIMGSIGTAMIAIKKNISRLRSVPEINDFEFLDNKECYECSNKCGVKVTSVRINNKNYILGKTCQL